MRIGFCAKPDQAASAAAAGFDYIEPPVNYIAGLTEEAFSACLDAVRAASIPTPSFNLLFPKTCCCLLRIPRTRRSRNICTQRLREYSVWVEESLCSEAERAGTARQKCLMTVHSAVWCK